MATPAWPQNVNYQPQADNYTVAPVDAAIRSQGEGVKAQTSRGETTHQNIAMTLDMPAEQFRTFMGFYMGTLNKGRKHFTMPVWLEGEYVTSLCRFIKMNPSPLYYEWWRVSLEIEVRNAAIGGVA